MDEGIIGTQASGILGMAPAVSQGDNAELFVKQLYDKGVIPKNTFGVNYQFTGAESTIILGGYDRSIVANDTLFSWVDLANTFYWSVDLKETTYGGEDLNLDATRAILDTGTSLTYFQNNDFNKIFSKIQDGRECGFASTTGFRACRCDSIDEFEDITFHLGGYIFFFPVDMYVSKPANSELCELWIDSLQFLQDLNFGRTSVLLGDSFIRNYYIYHDAENTRVGLFGRAVESGEGLSAKFILVATTLLYTLYSLM